MNRFMKSIQGSSASKQALVKSSITTQLSNSVKEIQLFGMDENLSGDSMDITEAENTLCTVIEAMFLHGLKDSLSYRFRKAIADVDTKPDPSFWAPLLVISHRQIIDQIGKLTQIHSETGQCRAWIRLVLNDCLLSSYLKSIQQASSSLKPYYNNDSYLRDTEALDVAYGLIEGLEANKTFTLPCNSSLLNTWPLPSLLLAGIWMPTLRSCPIASGVDVAESLQSAANSDACSVASTVSTSFSVGPLLNEDEALKIILGKKSGLKEEVSEQSVAEESEQTEGILGNSLGKKSGWSSEERTVEEPKAEEPQPVNMERSFNSLIESYHTMSGNFVKAPDVNEVWQSLERKMNQNDEVKVSDEESGKNIYQTESESLAVLVGKIAKEVGADRQNFKCRGCEGELNIKEKLQVCKFTGKYFCSNCMADKPYLIPSLVVYNWDFKEYLISQLACDYIMEIKDHPVIDFKVLNPIIYSMSEEMTRFRKLREQLNFLRAYLYTCQKSMVEEFQKKVWPRDYLYEHVHKYSISDLSQMLDGSLANFLAEMVDYAKQHVYGCWLCSQKAFYCEVCNNAKTIYPFEDNVYRCPLCSAVYHDACLDSSKPCLKCERRRKWDGLPNLDASLD